MNDTRQEAIDAIDSYLSSFTAIDRNYYEGLRDAKRLLHSMPSAQPEQPEPCELCSNLGKGDTLYQSSDWDGGIGFDYIWDIQYCPKCGRRLE